MSKSKNRANKARTNMDKRFSITLKQLEREASQPNIYKDFLNLSDDSDIRKLEQEYSPSKRASLRMYLIGDIRQMGSSNIQNVMLSTAMAEDSPDTVKDSLASHTILMLQSMLYDDDDAGRRLEKTTERIPEEFAQESMYRQIMGMVYQPFTDGWCNGLYSCISWNSIFTGNSSFAWCRNLLKLVKSLVPEEILNEYKTQREGLIHRIISYFSETVDTYEHKAELSLESMGLSGYAKQLNTALKPPLPPLSVLASPPKAEDIIRSMDSLPGKPALRPSQPGPFSQAPEWMLPLTTIAEYMTYEHLEHSWHDMLDYTSPDVITYTMLTVYTACESRKILPSIAESLFVSAIMPKAVDPATRRLIQPEETKYMMFGTAKPVRFDTDFKKKQSAKSRELTESDPEKYPKEQPITTATSLYSILSANGYHQPNHMIRIPLACRDLMVSLGYTENESMALAGYIGGLQDCDSQHAILGDMILNLFRSAENEHDEEELTPEQLKEQIRKEIEEYCAVLKNHADEEIQRAKTKAGKETQRVQYLLEQAEKTIQDLTDGNSERDAVICQLEAECERLRGLLPEDPDKDLEITGDGTVEYPCNIGSDHKILVVGGSENWVAELSNRFPGVRFFGAASVPDDRAIFGADFIFVNIFVLKHKRYWPVANAAKRAGKPLYQFPTRGINACSDYLAHTVLGSVEKAKEETDG